MQTYNNLINNNVVANLIDSIDEKTKVYLFNCNDSSEYEVFANTFITNFLLDNNLLDDVDDDTFESIRNDFDYEINN